MAKPIDNLTSARAAGRITREHFLDQLDKLKEAGQITEAEQAKAIYEFGRMPSDNREAESTITECVECGGKVSTKAKTCPHCGGPPTKVKAQAQSLQAIGCLLTLFVTVPILFLFFGMCA